MNTAVDHNLKREEPVAFDAAAPLYDGDFSHTTLGRWLRAQVWRHLTTCFDAGDQVLELGCGTGEDARFLAARGVSMTVIDNSVAMLDITLSKAKEDALQDRIETIHADLNDSATWDLVDHRDGNTFDGHLFDGALSDFGALNCVEDRPFLAEALAQRLRPGARAVFVVMGPFCPVESAAFLLRGRLAAATRRFRSNRNARVGNGTVRVFYPSASKLAKEFSPWFSVRTVRGIGTALPTTEMTAFVDRHPRLFRALTSLEPAASRVLGRFAADHYLMALERRPL